MLNGKRLAVLGFHGVDDPENFEQLMDHLARNYRPVSMDDLDRAANGGKSLPSRAVVVTFDDGHRSVYEHGLPTLAERGIPGAIFVIPGVIATGEDFWWSQVDKLAEPGTEIAGVTYSSGDQLVRHLKTVHDRDRKAIIAELTKKSGKELEACAQLTPDELVELDRSGITVGNHTWSHPCLNRCDPRTVEEEIRSAHEALTDMLGRAPRFFAYPNGDWDRQAEVVLKTLEYRLAFLFDHRLVSGRPDPLRLSRLRVNSDTSLDRFATILSGLHPTIHHARGRR